MPLGSKLDHVYRSILMTRFFTKGWGKPDNLKRLFAFRKIVSNRESCFNLVARDYPISIVKEETHSDCHILEGNFTSPFVNHLPGLLPKESETAYFQVILPRKWNSEHYKPVCLHLAGTGDHGFWRRRQIMAKPLLKAAGIGAVLLENPFYGMRKPKDQVRSSLHNVTDIFVMGGCLILESLALFHWCERSGLGPLGITGLSMGGHMASLAATNWPKPIVLVPCLSWSTASSVFTQGVMSESINWDLLETQYFSDEVYCDEIKKMVRKDEDAFRAGQHFAKTYPHSMQHVSELDKQRQKESDEQSNGEESGKQKAFLSQDTSSRSEKKECITSNKTPGQINFIPAGLAPQTIATIETEAIQNTQNSATHSSRDTGHQKNIIGENADKTRAEPKQKEDSVHSVQHKKTFNLFSGKLSLMKHFHKSKSKLVGKKESVLESSAHNKPKHENASVNKRCDREAFHFMRGIMDECTHLRNFDVPVDTSLIIAVCAKDDAYVPREGADDLADIWPGVEIRYLNAGHVSAYLLYQHTFRKAIVECFERLKNKYNTGGKSAENS